MEGSSGIAESAKMHDSRGDFFAVDRRAWHFVCDRAMNAAVAYLVCARGTGGDNRTTKWSVNAIEARTGISRSRAHAAVNTLIKSGALRLDPESAPSRPKYKIVPPHEIPGCEGYPPSSVEGEHARVYAELGAGWVIVPKSISTSRSSEDEYRRWGSWYPRRLAEELVKSGHAHASSDGRHFRAVRYDAEDAARPDWIWLPNTLIDGAAEEVSPIELMRQTGDVRTLRLLVNLYGSHALDEDGGIHFRHIRQSYQRHEVGRQGNWVVWGFVPGLDGTWYNSPFVVPYLSGANDEDAKAAAIKIFWGCWQQLQRLGLVEYVGHLVHADTAEGEIIHPLALGKTGLKIERELGRAACAAGAALITDGQLHWAEQQGIVMLAPVQRHIEGVQMVGVARLRYRPRTNRTLAFVAREQDWQTALRRLEEVRASAFATSRCNQGVIKEDQGEIKDTLSALLSRSAPSERRLPSRVMVAHDEHQYAGGWTTNSTAPYCSRAVLPPLRANHWAG